MHKNAIKFMMSSRFISSRQIDVINALSYEDSPVILRCEFNKAMTQTVASLRKMNGILTGAESLIPGRAHMHITGTF